jgi:hypothetical protein
LGNKASPDRDRVIVLIVRPLFFSSSELKNPQQLTRGKLEIYRVAAAAKLAREDRTSRLKDVRKV